MKENRLTSYFLVRCLLPLFLGFLVYLFFRKPNLLLHAWVYQLAALPNYYRYIGSNVAGKFLLYQLPDMLWAISLSYFLLAFLPAFKSDYLRAATVIFIVSLTELIQLIFPNKLTFDWIDLFISIITSFFIIKVSAHEKANSL